jgi:hypothetical protein
MNRRTVLAALTVIRLAAPAVAEKDGDELGVRTYIYGGRSL